MSVLMFVKHSSQVDWPTIRAMERFRAKTAEAPVTVFRYRPGIVDDKTFVNAVVREFEQSGRVHGHGVRLVLTGVTDPTMAGRLYQERSVPVNIIFSTANHTERFDEFGTMAGVTMFSLPLPPDDANVVTTALAVTNAISEDYRSYVDGLREFPSVVAADTVTEVDDVASAVVGDAYGDGVQAVELVLDALMERLCGAIDGADYDDGFGRWMSPATVVEYGDRVAENALYLRHCDAAATGDYVRRATQMAVLFAKAFWHDLDGRPTATDRALITCLVQNLRAAADQALTELSTDQFAMCLNAKFIATRNWRGTSGGPVPHPSHRKFSVPDLFHPEIRNRCEQFLGIGPLMDLMAAGDDRVFGKSHVEHLESYVLPQRLLEYMSRYYHHEVRYFALADTLVFRFTHGKSGKLVEQTHEYSFTGPKNFNEFHSEIIRLGVAMRSVNVLLDFDSLVTTTVTLVEARLLFIIFYRGFLF